MKLDIYKQKWIDMVFEGRNKAYGAYVLRKENPKTTIKSLLIGGLFFATLMALPMINWSDLSPKEEERVTMVDMSKLAPPPPPAPKVPPPPPPPPAPKIDEVKFVKPKVVEKEKVVEEIKTIEELKDKNVGAKDIKGDKDADFAIDKPSGEGEKTAEIIDNTVYNSAGIEVQPEFPGGWGKFGQYVQRNYRTPEVDQDLKGRVFVEFVVEKDGSLTDIKVVRDLGFGTGAEAVRMLKSAPKFKPGVQNGKTIRVRYSLPIMLDIKSE